MHGANGARHWCVKTELLPRVGKVPLPRGNLAGSTPSVPLREGHPAHLRAGSRQFAITVDHAG